MANVSVKLVANGNTCELLGADVSGAEERELTGVNIRVCQVDEIGNG